MKISAVLAALVVLRFSSALMASEQCYRDWMSERAQFPAAETSAVDAATALLFLQHLCGKDLACFSDERWRALDDTARSSSDPVILAAAVNVASYREAQYDLRGRWAQIEARDRGNAYPILLIAAANWKAGETESALAALARAAKEPRFDDYLAGISGLVYDRVSANPPTLDQLHPCARLGDDEQGEDPTEAERITAEVFDIGIGSGVPARVGDLFALCKQEPSLDPARADLCMSVGKLMTEHAPSQLMRTFGFALQRFATDNTERRDELLKRQQDDLDELHRKLWWVESTDSSVRTEASALWSRNFIRLGELRAAESLIDRFGEPPHEDASARRARTDQRMKLGQECYARYHHDS